MADGLLLTCSGLEADYLVSSADAAGRALSDGVLVIAGLGAVLVFLPQILILFFLKFAFSKNEIPRNSFFELLPFKGLWLTPKPFFVIFSRPTMVLVCRDVCFSYGLCFLPFQHRPKQQKRKTTKKREIP